MSQHWENVVTAVRKLPGVGPKMAERIALFLIRSDQTENIVKTILDAKAHLERCTMCGIFTEVVPCQRCSNTAHHVKQLCVLEEISDLVALERSGVFRGLYHLLGGALSPLDGIGPRELRIEPLIERLKKNDPQIDEIILATNPTVEGEATATYIAQLIHPFGKKVTRLAYGLPTGLHLEYADELTLSSAFEGRKLINS